MERLAPIWMLVSVGFFLVTLASYYEGMEVWLGWGFFAAFAVMLVAMFFQGIGGLFISAVGFYGMWRGFGWAWWQAALVAFPGIALMIVMVLSGGAASLLRSRP